MKGVLKSRGGFTLIELAIVLIIIGLILGAVLKGRDLIESAKIKKVYTNFVEGWILAVENYQDRTGQLLGDGTANGGTADNPDGVFDNINLAATTTVEDKLKAVGLEPPTTNTNNPGSYFINAKYTRSTMTAWLYNLHSYIDNRNYNAIYITGMPTDVAIALDTIIDGSANPSTGLFRRYHDDYTGADGTHNTWPNASTTATVNVMYIYK
ncbi:prepilin-type N-terminal cleavage/methylation domain-containing protein [Hippea jasoniae]|uniref:prepilin-type N-terminal cleavage/methylation domain-containing protein n=1 Tax=Hippea jasoniae TaxID=944479 RepID=UPI00068D6C40|nr:prepilin-type N-terminal cleavage/methylation domain-containing protein [Hippea jasoniae]